MALCLVTAAGAGPGWHPHVEFVGLAFLLFVILQLLRAVVPRRAVVLCP